METCPSCNEPLTDKGAHCPSCGVQAKCKVCGEFLNHGARFCVHCGAPIGEVGLKLDGSNGKQNNGVFNIIEVDRDNRSSRFRARVSDHAIDSLSKPLSLYLAGQGGLPTKRSEQHRGEVVIDHQPLLVGLGTEESDNVQSPGTDIKRQSLISNPADLETQRLGEVFRDRDGRLRLDEPQLKVSGKLADDL